MQDRESIEVISACEKFLRKAARLVSDVDESGLRTVKAGKVAQNKKQAITKSPLKISMPEKRRGNTGYLLLKL